MASHGDTELTCISSCSVFCPLIISFNHHNSMQWVHLYSPPLYREGNWGMEKSSNLPEGSQLTRWWSVIWTQAAVVYSRVPYWYIVMATGRGGFPGGASGKEPACNAGDIRDAVLIPGLGRFPWRRTWQPHSSILSWRIPWTEEPSRLPRKESDTTEAT